MIVRRNPDNPILACNKTGKWQKQAVFNGCPVKTKDGFSMPFRALSERDFFEDLGVEMEMSTIGVAESKDGKKFGAKKQLIVPEHEWEKYGCEDPRVTKLGNKYYIFYTALSQYPFNAWGIKCAVATSKDMKKIDKKKLVTPFNAKAMTMFPEKIDGKIWTLFSYHTDMPPTSICFAPFEKESEMWSQDYWDKWERNQEKYQLNLKRSDQDHVEIGAPPIKTDKGWLLVYSYITDYFNEHRVFTIEAVLLDLKNPKKIIGRTKSPILVPEEYYELHGIVPDIVFPSGAMLEGEDLHIYYGGADTNCSMATVKLQTLLDDMLSEEVLLKRSKKNPIISPRPECGWENEGTINPGAIYLDEKFHILYRSVYDGNKSVLGYARSEDGVNITHRPSEPVYKQREDFEATGCEDPRLIQIEDKIYMFYTAYKAGDAPRIAMSSISVNDFVKEEWKWSKPQLLSPAGVDNKDAAIFPEKINDKYYLFHRLGNTIDFCSCKDINFQDNVYLGENSFVEPRKGFWDAKKVGISTPPLKTKYGWLVLYHGITIRNEYKVGALMLDLENPLKILSRSNTPIFFPVEDYEKNGVVPNVVFPCGAIPIKNKLYVYYGGADKVCGLATVNIKDLIKKLYSERCEEWDIKP